MRNPVRFFLGFVTGVLLAIVLDYAVLNILYLVQRGSFTECFPVQGNTGGYIPQGMALVSPEAEALSTDQDQTPGPHSHPLLLQTAYNHKHLVSRLYVVDFETGELLKTLDLRLSDGTDHTGHAGGIATDGCTVWITGDSVANEYSLEEILGTEQGFVQSQRDAALPIRGDFCCWTEEALWIGDFFKKPFYPVPDDNPLLLKYVPNGQPGSSAEETAAGPGQPIPDYGKPQAVISLPRKVQGMAITENHRFVFTQSFTNMILSTVSVYENVLEEKPGEIIFNGEILPYYRFTDSNRCSVTRFPPMAEGLFCRRDAEGEKLYLLFENSSDAYFFAFPKVTNVISCTLPLNAQ